MCDSPSKELLAAVRSKIDIAFGEKHASPRKVCKHVSIELPIEEERYDKHTDLSQGVFVNCSPEKKNLKAPKFSESHPRNPKLSEIRSESIDFDCDLDSLASDDLMCDEHFFDDDDEAFLSKSAGHADLHEKSYKSGRLASRERSSSFEEKLEKRGSLRKKKKQGSYGSLPRVPKKKEETTSVDTLDELNQLMGNDKLTQRLRHLQSATRGRSHSSPSTFRPPRQLSMPIDDGDTVEIDYNSYSHMITEMTSVKTMLLRLKRVIQSSETMSPFDTSFKSSSSPLCTPCHSEPTSPVGAYKKLPPGYSLETLYQENQELRLKVLQFESKEEAWNSQREDKDREINSLKEQLRQFTQQTNKETCETAVQTDYVQSGESRFKRHQSLPPHQSPSKKDPAVQRSTSSITPQSAYIVPQQSANSVSKPTTEPQTNSRQASRLIKPQVQQNKFSPSIMALQNSKLQSTKYNAKAKNKESNLDSQKDNPMQGVTELQMQPRTDIVQNRLVEEPSARPNGDRKPPAEVSVVVQSSKSQTSSTPVISSSKHNSAHSQAKELNNVKDNTAKKNTSKVPIFHPRRSKQSPLADSPLNNELSSTLTLTNNEEQPSIDYPTPKNANKVRQPTETSSSGGRKKSRLPKPKSYNY
ncbi:kinesin-related protein 12-like isoform X3 [Ptychodera flava]|uniref:kinesin-related protein 12-like isoform X3 n=2 Tax=Ptychodera flava TaxID=63121 RepID=UPI00396AAF70